MGAEAVADVAAGDMTTASPPSKKQKLTKRQQRKHGNEKNKWPQHPKIQAMSQRNKAYVRVAGLGISNKSTSATKATIDPKLDLMSPEVKFGRLLGATDQRKRHLAVNKLKAYLKARCDISNVDNGGISELDLLKLWKGLWYTLYMADKVPVQGELSKRLAELLWCVAGTEEEDEYAGQAYMDMCEAQEEEANDEEEDEFDDEDVTMEEIVNTLQKEVGEEDSAEDEAQSGEEEADSNDDEEEEEEDHVHDEHCNHDHDEEDEDMDELDDSEIPHCRGAHLASLFIRTFFRTIKREWGNMDKYRVDKFYTLTRMYLHEIFQYMATRHWNLGIIRLFNDGLFEEVLNQTPNGLRYHLIDITLEELAKVNAKAPMPLTEATFLDTLEPYFAMCQTGGGGDTTVQVRCLERVLERFLDEYSVVSDKALAEQEEKDENTTDQEEEKEPSLIFDQVHVGSVSQFIFELASDPETKNHYRQSLYDMHKKYARRLKAAGTDVELAVGHVQEGAEDGEEDVDEENLSQEEEDSHEPEIEESEQEEDERKMEIVEVPKKKTTKNKRKRKDPAPVESDEPEPAKKGKSKKKKKKAAKVEEPQVEEEQEQFSTPKKSKKQKKQVTPSSAGGEEDEEVVISLTEQKTAKAEAKKKKKKKNVQPEESVAKEEPQSETKHVKFGKTNRSKSYKASMKALVTREPPKTSVMTPEKSILLNKGKKVKRAKVTKKAGRKRAISYF